MAISRTILVSGGGIAGLTAALCLSKKGYRVDVYEKAEKVESAGAGIQLSPNALRILEDLGLGRQLRLSATVPQGIKILAAGFLWRLATVPLGADAIIRYGLPYLTIHRADLVQCLLVACEQNPDITVHTGAQITDITSHKNGASALVSNKAGIRTMRGLAVVCADGVHSKLRTEAFEETPPVHSRFEAWRALIPADLIPKEIDQEYTHLILGRSAHAVLYPVSNGQYLNVVVVTKTRDRDTKTRKKADIKILKWRLMFWSRKFKKILNIQADWSVWPILKTGKTKKWHKGALVMIGDAAHAMVPYAAQGAAMAIEDAAVLANCMTPGEPCEPAFAKFEKLRRKRVAKVAALSESNGGMYHMGWPFSSARNVIMGLTRPKKLLERQSWIYDWKP